MTPYCPITHLAMTLNPSSGWGQTLLCMFTVCFDMSGKERDHECVIVAGFVSSAKVWGEFSKRWRQLLDREGIEYFRASDLQVYEGPFKTWKGQHTRRTRLWCDLLDIIEPNVFRKFACGLKIKDYSAKVSAEAKKRGKINAYVICAMACAQTAGNWAMRQGVPIEYVFEYGDEGWGMLQQKFKDNGYPPPIQRFKIDTVKKGITCPAFLPLQAADFLAYEIFITRKHIELKRRGSIARPMLRFREIMGGIKIYPPTGLERLNKHFVDGIHPFKSGALWRYS